MMKISAIATAQKSDDRSCSPSHHPDEPRRNERRPSLVTSRKFSANRCRIVGWITKQTNDGMKAFPVECGRWDCQNCCRRKGKQVFARIWHSEAKNFSKFLTLTLKVGDKYSLEEQVERGSAALSAFWCRLKKMKLKPRYVWVREVGSKKDMVHFHILVDRYLQQRLLSQIWHEVTGDSFIVDIRQARGSAKYICKYLAKMPDYGQEVMHALAGKRKYSASRGLLEKRPKSTEWKGAYFAVVSPMNIGYRCIAVVDGIFYFAESSNLTASWGANRAIFTGQNEPYHKKLGDDGKSGSWIGA